MSEDESFDSFYSKMNEVGCQQIQFGGENGTPLWLVSQRTQVGKGRERVKKKIIVPIISYPTQIEN